MRHLRIYITAFLVVAAWAMASGCTSALIPACKSANGKPMMWKHRDTSAPANFLQKVPASDSAFAYVALFNSADLMLKEAWMGMNESGFAIMNTASYNVAPYLGPKDKEGEVMTKALRLCKSVEDFCCLLDTIAKPAGIMANFGVMDAAGGLAYIEADDLGYRRCDANDQVLVRTNFSMCGSKEGGKGYERFNALHHLMDSAFERGEVAAEDFLEGPSRSFWHSEKKKDLAAEDYVLDDGKIIPRGISTASIVIEGGAPGDMLMWAAIGFPPCAVAHPVDLNGSVEFPGADLKEWSERLFQEASESKRACTVKRRGKNYFNMKKLGPCIQSAHERSQEIYFNHKNPQKCRQE